MTNTDEQPCTKVDHDAVDCQAAGLPPEQFCEPCKAFFKDWVHVSPNGIKRVVPR